MRYRSDSLMDVHILVRLFNDVAVFTGVFNVLAGVDRWKKKA